MADILQENFYGLYSHQPFVKSFLRHLAHEMYTLADNLRDDISRQENWRMCDSNTHSYVEYVTDIRIVTSNRLNRTSSDRCAFCGEDSSRNSSETIISYDHRADEIHENSVVVCENCFAPFFETGFRHRDKNLATSIGTCIDSSIYSIEDGSCHGILRNEHWNTDVVSSILPLYVRPHLTVSIICFPRRYTHWTRDAFAKHFCLVYRTNEYSRLRFLPAFGPECVYDEEMKAMHVLVATGFNKRSPIDIKLIVDTEISINEIEDQFDKIHCTKKQKSGVLGLRNFPFTRSTETEAPAPKRQKLARLETIVVDLNE